MIALAEIGRIVETTIRLAGRRIVVSVSGGKDSAAVCLLLQELGLDHERVFADTGWEHPRTYEYLRGPLTAALGPITEVRSPFTLPELVRRKGMFPTRTRRFCTQILKVFPLAAFVRSLDDDVVNAIGVRAQESKRRASMTEWSFSDEFDCDVWRPIHQWKREDVIAIHARHGLRPNPLYLMGASRVGCWPCIHARKAEIRLVLETDRARIDEIRQLESEVQARSEATHAKRGETIESAGHMRPTFFQSPLRERCELCAGSGCERCDGTGKRRVMWPIDKVAAWSRTSRGGRKLEMFADPEDSCAEWGMCESNAGDEA